MKVKLTFLIVLLLLSQFILAQKDYRNGYVINISGDTLVGQIDYRGDVFMSTHCNFKGNNNVIINFTPSEISGYRFENGRFYITKKVKEEPLFLEYLVNGKINIYYSRDGNGEHYYIDKEGEDLIEIPFEEKEKYINNKKYLSESTKHVGVLNYYFEGIPKMQSQINALKSLDHDPLIKLAKDYHMITCKEGEECIIYEKQEPTIKVDIEMVIGYLSFSNVDFIKTKGSLQSGVIGHLWLPKLNEKLYLRTGLLFSNVKTENTEGEKGQLTTFKIPIQLEYISPKGKIKPKFAYGFNIHTPFFVSVGIMGGINIKLNKSIYMCINYDIDFNPFDKLPFIPSSLLSNSITSGVVIKL